MLIVKVDSNIEKAFEDFEIQSYQNKTNAKISGIETI